MTTVTIPKKLTQKGDLVIIPRKEYERFLKFQQKLEWEEKDVDEAINVFKKERRSKKLKLARSFAAILK